MIKKLKQKIIEHKKSENRIQFNGKLYYRVAQTSELNTLFNFDKPSHFHIFSAEHKSGQVGNSNAVLL